MEKIEIKKGDVLISPLGNEWNVLHKFSKDLILIGSDFGKCVLKRGQFRFWKVKNKQGEKIMSIRTTKTTLTLECKLTESELKELSKKLAEAIAKKKRIESEIETYRAQKKGELQSLEGIILTSSEKVNSEKEWRPVECEIHYDFGTGIKSYVRKDTGELCDSEPISEQERQEEMALGEEAIKNGKKKK